jgi:chromosome segregation ATPase
LTASTQENRLPVDGLQSYIRDQLQHLRSEIFNYDETVTAYRKAEQANELLTQELNVQKEHRAQVEDQIHRYRQDETELKSRKNLLEKKFNDLKTSACDHHTDAAGVEQELTNLQHQMRQTEDAMRAKTTELDHANERLQEQEIEMAKAKVSPRHYCIVALTSTANDRWAESPYRGADSAESSPTE